MKKLLIAVAFGALFLPASLMAQVKVSEPGFSVTLPEGFTEFNKKEQTVPSPNGPIDQVTYLSKSPDGAFIVTYSDVKEKINDPKLMMENGRDSLLRSIQAQLESQKDITVAGNPGMNFNYKAVSPRPIYARTEFVVAGPRMYQVIFLGYTEEARTRPDVASSFQSFNVKPLETAKKNTAPKPNEKVVAKPNKDDSDQLQAPNTSSNQ